jgi:hypothetical protein
MRGLLGLLRLRLVTNLQLPNLHTFENPLIKFFMSVDLRLDEHGVRSTPMVAFSGNRMFDFTFLGEAIEVLDLI